MVLAQTVSMVEDVGRGLFDVLMSDGELFSGLTYGEVAKLLREFGFRGEPFRG